MTSDRDLHVGIAGCGRIARAFHVPGYVASSGAKIEAFYNHRLDNVSDLVASHPDADFYDDFEEFIAHDGLEAISVCTPNAMHAQMTITALEWGISVLVEKPMATTLEKAQRIITAASNTDSLFTVGQTQRFYPAQCQSQGDSLQEGRLGVSIR